MKAKVKAWAHRLAPFVRVGRTLWKYRKTEIALVNGTTALVIEIVRSVH